MDTLPATVAHFSSYDANGGNSDLGHYYGVDGNGWKILCDVAGPGVLIEFWWTKRNLNDAEFCRLYLGDTVNAILNVPLNQLCGNTPPFIPPLADSLSGGNFS